MGDLSTVSIKGIKFKIFITRRISGSDLMGRYQIFKKEIVKNVYKFLQKTELTIIAN